MGPHVGRRSVRKEKLCLKWIFFLLFFLKFVYGQTPMLKIQLICETVVIFLWQLEKYIWQNLSFLFGNHVRRHLNWLGSQLRWNSNILSHCFANNNLFKKVNWVFRWELKMRVSFPRVGRHLINVILQTENSL